MNKYTIEVDYFATGEGRTLIINYAMDITPEDALRNFIDNYSYPFYIRHYAEVKEGWVFDSEVAEILVSPAVQKLLNGQDGQKFFTASLHLDYG
jgi:hypothetical protein